MAKSKLNRNILIIIRILAILIAIAWLIVSVCTPGKWLDRFRYSTKLYFDNTFDSQSSTLPLFSSIYFLHGLKSNLILG